MTDNTNTKDAIVIERIFDAPVDLIWQMWTEAEHFKNWYGPQGFSIPLAEMDVQVGGKRLICMESPDGKMKMWTTGEYLEVVPTTRLVYTDSMSDENGNIVAPPNPAMPATTQVIVVLEELDGQTKMTMTHAGVPADSPGKSGWEQAFTKLADRIAASLNSKA